MDGRYGLMNSPDTLRKLTPADIAVIYGWLLSSKFLGDTVRHPDSHLHYASIYLYFKGLTLAYRDGNNEVHMMINHEDHALSREMYQMNEVVCTYLKDSGYI